MFEERIRPGARRFDLAVAAVLAHSRAVELARRPVDLRRLIASRVGRVATLQLTLEFDNLVPQEVAYFPARRWEVAVATPEAFQQFGVAELPQVLDHGAGR